MFPEKKPTCTHVPSSLLLKNTMKGSDFPKKSFLSSLLAQNCIVATSLELEAENILSNSIAAELTAILKSCMAKW